MRRELWPDIESALAAALQVPEAGRLEWVRRFCTNPEVRAEVESLLGVYSRAEGFLTRGPSQPHSGGIPSMAGRRVGAYLLVEQIGRGGMGAIYRAERADDEFRKQVAIKFIASELQTPEVLSRFVVERQILATLEHPNIARLLDGGVTEDGLPYIVMEYVEGRPITGYCDQEKLPVAAKLQLFRGICSAVHLAHQHLIVHRDLKPANVLVTKDGTPKLLDFGIAKLLGDGAWAHGQTLTMLPMTPEYASPEQARGKLITTASDVYSLGVLLYELLTGTRPYRIKGATLEGVLNAVCEQEPDKPSVAAGQRDPAQAAALRSDLAGDLDAIVLKAMQKDPAARYASAEKFSDDIGRYLAGLPISACRDTFRYVARKFVVRNKRTVVASAVALLLALAGVAGVMWEARIARQQRARADVERARAEQRFNDVRKLANSMMFELHDGVAPLPGSLPVRKLLVTRALEFLNTLARDSRNDRGLTLELAQGFTRVGEVQGGLTMASFGDFPAALASFTKARELLLPLYQANPSDPELGALMGNVYYRLEGVSVGLRDYSKALDYCARAEETYDTVLRVHPDNQKMMRGLAAAYFGHAVTLGQMDREPLSEYWRMSLDIYKTLIAHGSSEPNIDRDYSRSLTFYASRLGGSGKTRQALEVLHEAHAINEKRLAANPKDRDAATDLTMSYGGIAETLNTLGRPEEALVSYRKALSMVQQLSETSPQDVYLRDRLAARHFTVGEQLMTMRRFHEALGSFHEAIRINEDLASRRPAVSFSRAVSLKSWLNTGKIELTRGRRSAACADFNRSIQIYAEMEKEGPVRKADQEVGAEAAKAAASCAP